MKSASGDLDPRVVRLALHHGILMLASGALAQEVEASLLAMMQAFGLRGADAIVTNSTVTVSHVAPGDAQPTTAVQAVRAWRPDFGRLAEAAHMVSAIREGAMDLASAEAELARIVEMPPAYPRWLRFIAPALLSAAVTIMFGGSLLDATATLGIGLLIQPALERIERSSLPLFFQVVFGVAATSLLVVVLVGLGLPIDGGLVLTGGLLRFLPGPQLVSGMRDLIARAIVNGAANLAEVILLGVAIAGSASIVLLFGERVLGLQVGIAAEGGVDWPAVVIAVAGAAAVVAYAVRLAVPRQRLIWVAALGVIAVVIGLGLVPGLESVDRGVRTLLAAVLIGVIGRVVAGRFEAPSAVYVVPAILPLLPAPATMLPLLAESTAAREALQGQALETAFTIGVGVASGDILVAAYQRTRARVSGAARGSGSGP